jgi:hypothetical protein
MERIYFNIPVFMAGAADQHCGMNMERAVLRQEAMYAAIIFGQYKSTKGKIEVIIWRCGYERQVQSLNIRPPIDRNMTDAVEQEVMLSCLRREYSLRPLFAASHPMDTSYGSK